MTSSHSESAKRSCRLGIRGATPLPASAPKTPPMHSFHNNAAVVGAADHVDACSHHRERKAEGKIGPHYLRRAQRSKSQQGNGAQGAGAGRRKTHLGRNGEGDEANPFGPISCRPSNGIGAKVAKDLPAGGKDDDGAEHDIEQRLGAVLRHVLKDQATRE